ncbi:MAG TPA: peptidylprolyl isomerase [Kofleriaceae bacterium]|nr:peptidylprolyl isomerase [Kofleriaceae bacterium]
MLRRSLVAALAVTSLVAGLGGVAPIAAQPRPAPVAPRKTYVVDRVVAVVNDAIILDSELRLKLLPYQDDVAGIADPKERARRLDKLRTQVLDDMIDEELIVQAAEEARIDVEPKEIDDALREIKTQNKLDEAGFQQALTAQGYTLTAYRLDLRRQLIHYKAMNQIVAPKVNVTDDEVRARYDEMQRRSEAVSAVRLSHILFALPERPTEAEVDAAKDKAAQAIARVKAGEDFAKVATEMTDDANTRAGGGELGWIERGSLDPQWETVVFSMDKGEVRGPVSGPTGLHVFYVSDLKKTEQKSFDELKDQIKGDLRRRAMDKETQRWIAELRKKAYLDIKP